jgi:hypothetical protein
VTNDFSFSSSFGTKATAAAAAAAAAEEQQLKPGQ